MAAETILFRDVEAVLHFAIARLRAARRDRSKNNFLLAKFNAQDFPGNLRLIHVRENFIARSELGLRNHVGPHARGMILGSLGPAGWRLAVYLEYKHGMMRHEVIMREVRAVPVIANGDDHVRRG